MIEEVINNIIEAEEKADNIIKESQQKSKEIVAKAKEDAANLIETNKKSVQMEITQKTNAAFGKASTDAQIAIENCQKQADALEETSKKNREKAIEYIIGSMTTKYAK